MARGLYFMISARSFRFSGAHSFDDDIAANTKMFIEADRLDALAYKIINEGRDDPDAWARFSEAKVSADAQRTAAYQDWMRIKRQMK
jgi:hypothetical protein